MLKCLSAGLLQTAVTSIPHNSRIHYPLVGETIILSLSSGTPRPLVAKRCAWPSDSSSALRSRSHIFASVGITINTQAEEARRQIEGSMHEVWSLSRCLRVMLKVSTLRRCVHLPDIVLGSLQSHTVFGLKKVLLHDYLQSRRLLHVMLSAFNVLLPLGSSPTRPCCCRALLCSEPSICPVQPCFPLATCLRTLSQQSPNHTGTPLQANVYAASVANCWTEF